jgi:hypothetical protein
MQSICKQEAVMGLCASQTRSVAHLGLIEM